MPTVKLILEYDGTAYAGWQRQLDQPTIQQAVETAIEAVTQVRVPVIGAGRTDAGVHAWGQVASFRIEREMTPLEWTRALNARLPEAISVRAAEIMPDTFHARHRATGKLYEYRILNRPERPALERHFCWHVYKPLDDAAMNQAALALVGRHDCSSFETQPTENEDPVCHVQRLAVFRQGDLVRIEIYADRFLKQMVRSIVGTLVEVGLGKRTPESFAAVLAARDRAAAGKTAPPQGLFLVRVDY
ncbi:tRNA pseudouridine(38-40) synthase TruA [Nitrospira moscoviensis]|uniref:tRNA pseudouridine synthase A n=1 Tax=Nitrospira moscoviensis TaxID=42253 RepID=A0A0K2GGW5_NITMO|nr:tRNA pseudouridine(38-40) synthase TruA [Nitrospira moscoviensis]ALA59857.1 tRNA pseudouridine synthase A [Nitrospira moscoviensis]